MPKPRRHWTHYPVEYAALAKSAATATLPVLYGPYPRRRAFTFRQGFYRFRESLRISVLEMHDQTNSHPARLLDMIMMLTVSVEQSTESPTEYDVIFDLDPIVEEMRRLDPAAAQVRQLSRAQFIAAQRPSPISTPMFSPEEMQDRLDVIEQTKGTKL